jgi:hypothetical protein
MSAASTTADGLVVALSRSREREGVSGGGTLVGTLVEEVIVVVAVVLDRRQKSTCSTVRGFRWNPSWTVFYEIMNVGLSAILAS